MLEKKKIGLQFRELRKQLGLTQKEMARIVGVTPAAISDFEAGKSSPSANLCAVLAKKFKVNLNWLLTGEGEMFVEDTKGLTADQHKALEAIKKDGKIAKIAVMLDELPEDERRRFYIRILEAKLLHKLLKEKGVESLEELSEEK